MVHKNRYAEALALQDACNPSGVARTLVEIIDDVKQNGADTAMVRYDPAVQLTIAKLADLCGLDYNWPRNAEAACQEGAIAAAGIVE